MQVFEDIYVAKQKTVDDFHDAGGMLTMGTDHVSNGNYLPGFGVHRELDAFVRSGIPAADALIIGTINGAKALKIDKSRGSLETGKIADLFIIEGNPLENIRNTRKVQQVMTAGNLFGTKQLLKSVEGKLGPQQENEVIDW